MAKARRLREAMRTAERQADSALRGRRWGSGVTGGDQSPGKIGGRVTCALGDIWAAMAASRHSNSYVVTASVDTSISNADQHWRDVILKGSEPGVPDFDGSGSEIVFGKRTDW